MALYRQAGGPVPWALVPLNRLRLQGVRTPTHTHIAISAHQGCLPPCGRSRVCRSGLTYTAWYTSQRSRGWIGISSCKVMPFHYSCIWFSKTIINEKIYTHPPKWHWVNCWNRYLRYLPSPAVLAHDPVVCLNDPYMNDKQVRNALYNTSDSQDMPIYFIIIHNTFSKRLLVTKWVKGQQVGSWAMTSSSGSAYII